MRNVRYNVLGVLETEVAYIELLSLPSYEIFWVEGGIPCFEQNITKHDVQDITGRFGSRILWGL